MIVVKTDVSNVSPSLLLNERKLTFRTLVLCQSRVISVKTDVVDISPSLEYYAKFGLLRYTSWHFIILCFVSLSLLFQCQTVAIQPLVIVANFVLCFFYSAPDIHSAHWSQEGCRWSQDEVCSHWWGSSHSSQCIPCFQTE